VQKRRQEKFQGGGGMVKLKPSNTPVSLPLLYQWGVKVRNGHTSRAHLKVTLHQEPSEKMKTMFGETPIFRKNAYLFKKSQAIFVRKNFVLGFLVLNSFFLTSTSAAIIN